MKYPSVTHQGRSPELVDAMIEDIADREREVIYNYRNDYEDPYSKELGALCLAVADKHGIPQMNLRPEDASPSQAIYERLGTLVKVRNNETMVARIQRRLHTSAIAAVRENLYSGNDRRFGILAENVCLAVLTRYAHPKILAYPSLQHHELNDDIGGHYDVGVIVQEPRQRFESYFLQVKGLCLGTCNEPNPTDRLDEYMQKYRPIVQFISSCCDLKMGAAKQPDLTVAELLVAEQRGRVTKHDIKRLDNLTDSILLKMSADLLLRGKRGGRSIGLTAEDYHATKNSR